MPDLLISSNLNYYVRNTKKILINLKFNNNIITMKHSRAVTRLVVNNIMLVLFLFLLKIRIWYIDYYRYLY